MGIKRLVAAALMVLAVSLSQPCLSSNDALLASPSTTSATSPLTNVTACENCDLWVGVGVGLGVSALILILLLVMVVALLVVKKAAKKSYSYQPLITEKL